MVRKTGNNIEIQKDLITLVEITDLVVTVKILELIHLNCGNLPQLNKLKNGKIK
jgi:hypothetical protein